jgi:hypothetical protein
MSQEATHQCNTIDINSQINQVSESAKACFLGVFKIIGWPDEIFSQKNNANLLSI